MLFLSFHSSICVSGIIAGGGRGAVGRGSVPVILVCKP